MVKVIQPGDYTKFRFSVDAAIADDLSSLEVSCVVNVSVGSLHFGTFVLIMFENML